MPYHSVMFEFIETPFFTKNLDRYLDDDEYRELQTYLSEHPESGKIVSGSGWRTETSMGSGGARKARWPADHLLPAARPCSHLDAHALQQERA